MAYRSSRGFPFICKVSNRCVISGTPNGGNSYEGNSYLEHQNDNLLEGLRDKISTLKRVTINIGDDVRAQNRLLDDIGGEFEASQGLLGATMKKLGIVSRAGGKFFDI